MSQVGRQLLAALQELRRSIAGAASGRMAAAIAISSSPALPQ